jgi:hypothetical protein
VPADGVEEAAEPFVPLGLLELPEPLEPPEPVEPPLLGPVTPGIPGSAGGVT